MCALFYFCLLPLICVYVLMSLRVQHNPNRGIKFESNRKRISKEKIEYFSKNFVFLLYFSVFSTCFIGTLHSSYTNNFHTNFKNKKNNFYINETQTLVQEHLSFLWQDYIGIQKRFLRCGKWTRLLQNNIAITHYVIISPLMWFSSPRERFLECINSSEGKTLVK